MRRSLLAGLIEAAAGNQRRGAERVLLGEVGRAFFADGGKVREEERLALALAGTAGPWDASRPADFPELKGLLAGVLAGLGIGTADWRPTDAAVLAAGYGAEIVRDGRVVGIAGRLADDVAALLEVPAALWVAELDLTAAAAAATVVFASPARHPAVVSDLTVRHRLDLAYEQLVGAVRAAAPSWLESVQPLVRYRGEGVGREEVKTTLRLTYRHPDRSLTQDEVNAGHFAVMDALARQLGVSFS
jgi:phenylalanyl-tRNA synthetase beta chain